MNTIPTTFNRDEAVLPPYTVVGGMERNGSTGLSAVVLNRGSRYPRKQVFTELEKAAFDYIISVENPAEHYEIEELAASFPQVMFILLSRPANLGEQINIAAQETRSPLFFVLWNDTKILYGGSAEKITEKLLLPTHKMSQEETPRHWYRRICTIPVFQNHQFEPLPTGIAPVVRKHRIETMPYAPTREDTPTLYPYQGSGVYDKLRFLRLGGFDNMIKDPYWQLMDFGFRAWLWGEEICCTHHIRLRFDGQSALEAGTDMDSYRRFYLKNILPVARKEHDSDALYGYLPLKKLFPFLLGNAKGGREKMRSFFQAREWVRRNQHSWKQSLSAILRHWEDGA